MSRTNKKEFLPKNSINFSVIIPNYNGAEFLLDCLNSLNKSISLCPQNQFELIFVDNGSIDNSVSLVKEITNKFSTLNTKYLILNTNNGFASAVNQGINQAKYKWVVVLNNDLIIKPNWFKIISQEITNNKNTQVSTFFGTVLNKDGTKIESQGFKYDYSGKCTNISNGKIFNKQNFILNTKYKIPNTIIWGAPAALIVYNKNIIKKIGLFDQDFFAYQEDVDLAFRLYKFGYLTQYIPSAISYHFGGGTSNRMGTLRYRMNVRNWIYLIIKNYSFKEFWSNFLSIMIERFKLLSELIIKTIEIYKFKSLIILPIDLTKTFFEIIFNLPKMLHKRHQIQKMLKSYY
jgi:GT2 family glycosyltransferase